MRHLFITIAIVSVGSIFASVFSMPLVRAQVMQSNNYQIQSDSINFGGGFSSSTNFRLESTAGEIATRPSNSGTYYIGAGYQEMQEVYIAITGASDVAMSPAIPGITGGTANGSTSVIVTTDSPSGYQLSIEAENDPAMQKNSDTIADYDPGGDPDYAFTTGAADAHFGYSPEGDDIVSRFLDNGSNTCNTGSTETHLACWDGLTTSPVAIASNTNANHPYGATTTVYFRVGVGSAVVVPAGSYTATTTLTALPL